jgi:hypothetical protein
MLRPLPNVLVFFFTSSLITSSLIGPFNGLTYSYSKHCLTMNDQKKVCLLLSLQTYCLTKIRLKTFP